MEPFKVIRLPMLLILLALSWAPLATRAQQSGAPKRVLVLYWYDKNFPGHVVWDQSFQATLKSAGEAIEYYPEYLEANRFPGENQTQALHDYLKQKYADRTVDVVVAQSDASLNFLLKYRDDLFPHAPIVFYAGSRPPTSVLEGRTDLTGVIVISSYKKTLDLALALNPQVNQVFVISGTLERDKSFEVMARDELRGFEGRVEINYLTDLSPEELIARTASLPPRSLVLYAWQQARNAQGQLLESVDILSSITRTTPVPIFGMSGPLVGHGVIGGHVYTPEAGAAKVAEMVRRIAGGARAQDIPIEGVPTIPMFDWRELRRWRISEDSLPKGSVVLFTELTFWELYKWYIIALVGVCLIEGLLISWLLFTRARRRQAERENQRLARIAEAERRELDEVVSNVPGLVWETHLEPGSNIRKTTFISDYIETMLGFTAAEWLSKPAGFGFTLIPDEEDRERAKRDCEAVMVSGKEGFTQYRWTRKDGRTLWVESHLTPIVDDGNVVGLRVTLDISNRKQAIDELRQSEERFGKAFRANPQPMSLTTVTEGRYLDVNDSFLAMSGYTRDEVIGHTALELKVWETDKTRANFVRQLEEQGSIVNVETIFRTNDGSLRVLLSSAESLEIAGEKCLLIASSDITERKEAEDALRTAHEEVSRLKNQLQEENIYLREEINLQQDFGEIVGRSDVLRQLLFKIEQVAPTDTTVLITGETGTGKELVARAIHNASARRERQLVKVNCAALTPSLIESELFGHEKGAFTGASGRKIGRFELASGATLFLDEIGELPTELQVKLLRVIQEGEFERLGSSKTIKADVRLIAATNRNLDLDVKQGRFREDLWYRLNVFPINVPPLRQHREDIPLLVEHFVRIFAKKLGKVITSVSPATMKSLRDYSWPGNVRELANIIERAVINSRGSMLRLSEEFAEDEAEQPPQANKSLDQIERDYIVRILNETNWRIEGRQGAAQILGINPILSEPEWANSEFRNRGTG